MASSTANKNNNQDDIVEAISALARVRDISEDMLLSTVEEACKAAFRVLRAKLYELEERKRAEELDELRGERRDNSFGSQIRNYVLFPYQLVKDLRSGVETGNVDAVLSGALEPFVIGYHTWRVANS